jgi:2-C-methyl-D-erythritol 2,4-cyclodiphosphate synthase
MRIGFGFDAHRFAPGRKLVLGGIEIPHDQGLLGHSDADVLTHAIVDALLGAAGLPDIGTLFPDTDPRYRDLSSLMILAEARARIATQGYGIVNIDTTVVCESPRIGPYVPMMKEALARTLEVEPAAISIKGKTTEQMGFTGRGEGIAGYAVALLRRTMNDERGLTTKTPRHQEPGTKNQEPRTRNQEPGTTCHELRTRN